MIVDQAVISSYQDLGYTAVTFNSTASVVYSKAASKLPPTTIKVEHEPCMDAMEQSSSPGEQFYLPEMMRDGCTEEKNTGLVYDTRFTPSGLFTDLYSIQTDSKVTNILEAEPSFSDYVTTDEKKGDRVSSWNRPTLNYNL